MKDWLLFSLLSLFFWGLWAFFPRYAVVYISPRSMAVYQTAGQILAVVALLFFTTWKVEWHPLGAFFAALTGVLGILGFYFFSLALKKGNASVVTALTSIYPLIAVILFFLIFRETVTAKQGVGIAMALGAVVLLSS